MSDIIKKGSLQILTVAMGLLTSGCPMMMIPMMGGMQAGQHQGPQKEPPEDANKPKPSSETKH
ncbi:MAG: hypothetical protein HQL96_15400 [Magnetococcales bacterium]|nr:hypothetical protein [Magnetococcales bacterium]